MKTLTITLGVVALAATLFANTFQTKEIGGLAGELDEAGDANNGKLVTSLAAKFRMHVNMIPSVYPKGAFPMKAAMPTHKPAKKAKHDDHHGGGH